MNLRTIIVVSVLFFACPLHSQDWMPSRIVGIDYPVLAIQARIAGTVKIKCILDEDGKVVSTEILDVAGTKGTRELLGKAAQDNAMKWVFGRQNLREQRSALINYHFEFEVRPSPAYLRSRFIFDFPQSVRVIAEIPNLQISK